MSARGGDPPYPPLRCSSTKGESRAHPGGARQGADRATQAGWCSGTEQGAERGREPQPVRIEQQARRLLADPRSAALALTALALLGCGGTIPGGYPAHWWQPVPGEESWEIPPDAASPGKSVVLSKRNELGLLSNFAPTPFELDGVRYASVEGFWQMMRFPEGPGDPRLTGEPWPHTRAEVAAMAGFEAKRAGNAAKAILTRLGIDWMSYRGQRLLWRGADRDAHRALILRAMRAKAAAHPDVRWVLWRTGTLELLPDHRLPADRTPAYEYHRMWAELRGELVASDPGFLPGWDDGVRDRIARAVGEGLYSGERKVAVFDGDGTLWHADVPREFLAHQIRERRLLHFDYDTPGGVERLYATCRYDVSICIAQAAYLYVGLSLDVLRSQAEEWMAAYLDARVFPEQKALVAYLLSRDFDVWVVSGGPRWLAQAAAKRYFGIPPERVLGVDVRVVDGRLGAEVVPPVPFREGKAAAAREAIGRAPDIASGNSAGDVEMLALASRLAIAVSSFGPDHPGFHFASEQKLGAEARRRGWAIQRLAVP